MAGHVARQKSTKLQYTFKGVFKEAQPSGAITSSQLCMRLRTSMFGYRI